MNKRNGIFLILYMLMLSGCVNHENSAMLYEIAYPQGTVTSTSMYGDEDYNTHTFYDMQSKSEAETPKEKEIYSVSVYLQPTESDESQTQYKSVGEIGNFIMECQRTDGTMQSYEFASELKSNDGNKIVLRSELLKEKDSLLVFVEEWNSMFYTAYIDGYLVQTEVYQIDIHTGEILWKAKGGKNELLLTADTTKEGETLYMYKEGTINRLTGEDFKQEEKLGEISIKDNEGKDTLLFEVNEKTICISCDNTGKDIEFERKN